MTTLGLSGAAVTYRVTASKWTIRQLFRQSGVVRQKTRRGAPCLWHKRENDYNMPRHGLIKVSPIPRSPWPWPTLSLANNNSRIAIVTRFLSRSIVLRRRNRAANVIAGALGSLTNSNAVGRYAKRVKWGSHHIQAVVRRRMGCMAAHLTLLSRHWERLFPLPPAVSAAGAPAPAPPASPPTTAPPDPSPRNGEPFVSVFQQMQHTSCYMLFSPLLCTVSMYCVFSWRQLYRAMCSCKETPNTSRSCHSSDRCLYCFLWRDNPRS